MSQTNSIAVSIPEADLAEIRGAIGVLRAKLAPHLKCLTPQDRQELPKMGDKTLAFVQKAYEYGTRNHELAPGPYVPPYTGRTMIAGGIENQIDLTFWNSLSRAVRRWRYSASFPNWKQRYRRCARGRESRDRNSE